MSRIFSLFLIFVSLIPFVIPACNESQVDINSASLEELDSIVTIGPAIAEKIILMRPFSSVNDLIDISGIGNKTLEKIKEQGLACVGSETRENNFSENISEDDEPASSFPEKANQENYENPYVPPVPATSKMIVLTPDDSKDIKIGANLLSSDKVALYGLIAFGLLIGGLLAAKRLKSYKTEFINEK